MQQGAETRETTGKTLASHSACRIVVTYDDGREAFEDEDCDVSDQLSSRSPTPLSLLIPSHFGCMFRKKVVSSKNGRPHARANPRSACGMRGSDARRLRRQWHGVVQAY